MPGEASAHPEEELELVAVGPAQLQLGAILEDQHVLAVGPAAQLLDAVDVDDGRAVHPREAAWIQPRLEVPERLAEKVLLPLGVDLHVVFLPLDPLAGVDRKDRDAHPAVHGEALQPAAGPRPGAGLPPDGLDPGAGPVQRPAEAI